MDELLALQMLGFPEVDISYINGLDWYISATIWAGTLLYFCLKNRKKKVIMLITYFLH